MIKKSNQLNPPPPKKRRVDALGNDKRRAYYKNGDATMVLCENITENAAKAIENNLKSMCEKLGTKLKGHILWAR